MEFSLDWADLDATFLVVMAWIIGAVLLSLWYLSRSKR